MRRILLAVLAGLAGLGVLAAGCTGGAPQATPSRAPTDAAECAAINDHTSPVCAADDAAVESRANAAEAAGCRELAPDGSCILTVSDIPVGGTALLVPGMWDPFESAADVCILRGDATIDVVPAVVPSHALIVDHPARLVWELVGPGVAHRMVFTEGPGMRGLLTSDGKCPASPR